MAFVKANFPPLGGQSSRGKAPMQWAYATDDTLATVDGVGYFDNGSTTNTGMRNIIKPGDKIYVAVVSSLTADPWVVADAGNVVVLTNASGIIDTSDETAITITDTD